MSRPVTPATANLASSVERDASGVAYVDHAGNAPHDTSYLSGGLHEHDTEAGTGLDRPNSQMSQSATAVPSRHNTLKKKAALQKSGSLKRSGSRKSSFAGSVRSLKMGDKEKYEPEDYHSAFYCPVPIIGSPTELLANRFQGMSSSEYPNCTSS